MIRLCAQGDILIERVDDAPVSGRVLQSVDDGSAVVAAGEATGHHHRIFGSVTLYRDDALAREIPAGLYVAHLQVKSPGRTAGARGARANRAGAGHLSRAPATPVGADRHGLSRGLQHPRGLTPCATPHPSMPSKSISTAGRPRTCPASRRTAGRRRRACALPTRRLAWRRRSASSGAAGRSRLPSTWPPHRQTI